MRKLLFLLILCNVLCFAQRADFVRENITFRLDSNYFNVDGFYYLMNRSDHKISSEIFYPFPAYAGPEIDSIGVFDILRGAALKFTPEGKNGISFKLHIDKYDSALIRVTYRQMLVSDSAVYILKTIAGWGKPLQSAEFKLVMPASFIVTSFSISPDELFEVDNLKIYAWKKNNFMPRQDMIFKF